MGFDLRSAREQDLAALLRLEARAFERPWPADAFRQELELPQAELWLAWRGEQLAGYVDFWVVADEVELLNVAVDPEFRRRGLARRLLRLVEERGAERGGAAVYLEVRRTNEAAQALYKAVGYAQIGIRKRYYSDTGEDAVLMSKDLAPPSPTP